MVIKSNFVCFMKMDTPSEKDRFSMYNAVTIWDSEPFTALKKINQCNSLQNNQDFHITEAFASPNPNVHSWILIFLHLINSYLYNQF